MRQVISINEGWRFVHEQCDLDKALHADGVRVDLPHTWNAVDGMDGTAEYDRGSYWYVRDFDAPTQPALGNQIYVEVLAAGQQATVYVNGKEVTHHEGGYSAFRANITKNCHAGKNQIAINCDNSHNDGIYPQKADFTFYGGLYRGVNIISVTDTHFDLDYFGGPGVYVTPKPCKESGGAVFNINSYVTNADADYTVLYSILDEMGYEVAGGCRPADDAEIDIFVPDAANWSPDDPYLYTVIARLQRRNETVDEIYIQSGVRSFACDPNKGFILNGEELPLRGVSRHQCRLYKGNAIDPEDHYEDAAIIKEIGANTIRLAHYQHNQHFYNACDQMGFVVWAEIPFISVFNDDPAAHQNCISQMTELVIQNYNHPSICFWGLSNEILIGPISDILVENHKELNALVKKLDPSRLTTIAQLSATPIQCPLHHITDVMSYNHYFGWYGGYVETLGPWMDNFHKVHPDISLGLSEYGCEGILTYHSPEPALKDYSEDYQAIYHEKVAQMLEERPYIWSSHVWNMFDFGVAARNEGGIRGRNNKGLVTIDRKTYKDAFYVYQAYWSKEPMIHICGRRYAQRAGDKTEIKVYSNCDEIELFINGKLAGLQKAHRVFKFDVALEQGQNIVVAVVKNNADKISDSITLQKVEKEPDIYTLQEVRDRRKGVKNWYEDIDKDNMPNELEYPDGRFNVKDSFAVLFSNAEVKKLVQVAIKLSTNYELVEGDGQWDMFQHRTPYDLRNEMIGIVPEGFLETLNAKLIQYKKEN